MMAEVLFYYSIGSRYSYLAASQLGELVAETGCSIDWQPLNSMRLLSERGGGPFRGDPISGQYDWSYRTRDAERWAELYGIPFVETRGRVEIDAEALALAATAAKRIGQIEAVSRELFAAVFDGTNSVVDANECVRRAEACGLSAQEFRSELEQPSTRKQLEHAMKAAHRAGVFGVPTFVVGGELFWGNDRLVLLKRHIERLDRRS
jgi:2-hydroxychromene-2-carboxylate isomerase